MEATVLNNIPFQINIAQLLKNLDKQKFAYSEERVKELADIASSIGRPKAIYKEAYVENRDGDTLIIDGMKFSGRVISVNLAEVHKVVAYVITSGNELEEWSQSFDNDLDRAYLGAIKELVLLAALEFVYQEIDEKYNFPKASNMNPGSLKDWPLTEQNSLFALLGEVEKATGVKLAEDLLMVPVKTVSGIRFSLDIDYVNCQLCPREACRGRRAAYDANLYQQKYGLGQK